MFWADVITLEETQLILSPTNPGHMKRLFRQLSYQLLANVMIGSEPDRDDAMGPCKSAGALLAMLGPFQDHR